jgi:hypothetical protein
VGRVPDADDQSAAGRRFGHHRELAVLAAKREVVHIDQLLHLGYSAAQVRRQVTHGLLHRVHHNVYAIGSPSISPRAALLAALLTVGPHSFLSHRTAAAVHGLRVINTHDIELTLPGTGGRHRPGLQLHRTQTDPHPDDVRTRGDLRVSSVPRMLIELAARETPAELERLVTEAVRKRLLRLDSRDGRPYHVAAQDMERDRIKDAFLLRVGITPVRYTDFRMDHDVPGILRDLQHFLNIT